MKGKLKAYQKEEIASEIVQTTISIRKDQKKIIDENQLNLSALVRDLLDQFLEEGKDNEDKED